jgi:hypothetical protein
MAGIEWNIRHFLKDGTEIKKGDQFPDTAENRATIERVRELCQRHLGRLEAKPCTH